jgi:hypothetical protein
MTLAFGACANTAPPAAANVTSDMTASATTTSATATSATTTRPTHATPRTGGNTPPERYALACKVDADCTTKPACQDTACRCVREKCIASRTAVDPVIDPVPPPPPQT